MHTVQTNPTK